MNPAQSFITRLDPVSPAHQHLAAEFAAQGEDFLRHWLVPGALLGGLLTLIYLLLPFTVYQENFLTTFILYCAVFGTYLITAAVFHFGRSRININLAIFLGWTVVTLLSFTVMRITNDFTSASGILVLTVVAYAGLIPWPARYTVYFFGLVTLLYFSMALGFDRDDNWIDFLIYGALLLVVVLIFAAAYALVVRLRWQNFLNEQLIKEANVRLQEDLALAKDIQQRLLPPPAPPWTDFEIRCHSIPAREVGGDLYNYHAFETGGGARYAVAVGDISGKGLPAALLMATSLAHLTSIEEKPLSPSERMLELDEAMIPYTQSTGHNCALCYVEMVRPSETDGWQLCAVNAGCIPPYIKRTDGSVEWLQARGVPLGIGLGSNLGYAPVTTHLSPGDLVILTSDGVPEANTSDDQIFGFERLEAAIAAGPSESAMAMQTHLLGAIKSFVGSAEQNDDLTIVVLRLLTQSA
jgi:serine phosphatase RsbU (regulator of sigma subunit)